MLYQKGTTTKQAHVDIPDGLVEEEYARNGFFGRYAHLYRTAPPTGWTDIDGELKPQAFQLERNAKATDFVEGRRSILENADVKLQFLQLNESMPYFFRNADSDDLFFVHRGCGRLYTDFGPLNYQPGDYLVVPRGTVYRFLPQEPSDFLVVESASEYRLPDKGMIGQHALFDPAVINVPEPTATRTYPQENSYHLYIKRCDRISKVTYPFDPINTVGWKGDLTVWQLNVKDIRPISCDRYHLPPSAHTTFLADNFVVCTFLPRPLENGDPAAMKVPFYHSNIDFDEVLFYHAGQFFSRAGIDAGMMTFHPQGIHHGPQNEAIKAAKDKTATEEIAVMIDTKRPLFPGPLAAEWEIANYWQSWRK